MKQLKILFFVTAITNYVIAQPAYNWDRTSDTSLLVNYRKMFTDPDGSIYVGGTTSPSQSLIIKYDQFGNTLWEATDTGFIGYAGLRDMCLGENGNIYSTGVVTTVNTWSDAYLSKYDSDGNLLWQRYYNGPLDSTAENSSMIFFNSYIYTAGRATDLELNDRVLIQKYDINGNLIWTYVDTMENSGEDAAFYLTHDNQDIILTGFSEKINVVQRKMFIAKYDTAGNKIWQAIDDFGYEVMGGTLAIDYHNNIYATVTGSPYYDVVKYDSYGNFQWGYAATPDIPTHPAGYGIIRIDDADNVYLSGAASMGGGIDGTSTFLFTKLKPDGEVVFNYVGQYGGGGALFDFLTQNDIIITGKTDAFGHEMINFDSLGNIQWTHHYRDDVLNSYCYGALIDSMGNILLGGKFDLNPSNTHPALLVIKYGNDIITGNDYAHNETDEINVYPVPASDNITIITAQKTILEILNTQGQIIRTINNDDKKITIKTDNFPSGLYIIKAMTDKSIATKKFIVE